MNEIRIARLVMGGFHSLCIGIDLWQVREGICGEEPAPWRQKVLDGIRLIGSSTWAVLWAESASVLSLGPRASAIKLLCSSAFVCVYGASACEDGGRDLMHVAGYVSFAFWSALFALGVFMPSSVLLPVLQLGSCALGVGCLSLSLFNKSQVHEKKITKA